VVALAAVPRLWAALKDSGILWPDETILSTEPAHYLAFGWGMLPREFREGARSWLFPGILGGVWKLAALLGVRSSVGLIGIAKVGMAVFSLAAVWFAMSLARRLSGERAAVLAGLLLAACPPLVVLGSRCLAETAAVPFVVLSALLLETSGRRHAIAAGVVATVSVFVHYPNGVVAVALLALLVARRRRADARAYAVVAAVVFVLLGLLDWPTWGWPWKALLRFMKVAFSGHVPRVPLDYYSRSLASSLGLTYGLLLFGLALAWRRARGLVLVVVVVAVVHSLAPQKELRFLLPILPLAIALASVGLVRVFDGLGRRGLPTYAFGLACAAQMGWITHEPTRGQLGSAPSDGVVWHSGEDYFRAIQEAARAPDLCGVVYAGNDPRWTAGYTYLHRSVPLFFDTHPEHLAAANFVVGAKGEKLPAGWTSAYTNGKYALYRRAGMCNPPPRDWTMNLP
jgi:hypothetical protein